MSCAIQGFDEALAVEDDRFVAYFEGFRLESTFQPIFSHAHHRAIGHEALLRITDSEGAPIGPLQFLCKQWAPTDAVALNALIARMHVANFRRSEPVDRWLFLNVDPVDTIRTLQAVEALGQALRDHGISPESVVIEIVEQDIPNSGDLLDIVAAYRELGCLIAIDDFGTGFSNLARMIKFRPDIVKLDRTFVSDTGSDVHFARCLPLIVNMLHEIGSLVLAEGVENEQHALTSVRADVDLMQGFYFARPQRDIDSDEPERLPQLRDISRLSEQKVHDYESAFHLALQEYQAAFSTMLVEMRCGTDLPTAAIPILTMERAVHLYVLDTDGLQVGGNVHGANRQIHARSPHKPLINGEGAKWAHRPYFRRARLHRHELQVTRPYLSLTGAFMCVTLSQSTDVGGREYVVCCDLEYPLSRAGQN